MFKPSTSIKEEDPQGFINNVNHKIEKIKQEIKEQYLEDDIPWVIGFSGGKDSTTILQLIFYSLSELPESSLQKEIHVLSNDTLVENPNIASYIERQIFLIEKTGKENLFKHNPKLFTAIKVVPKLEDTFWLNLIGKGYPSPNRWFRWCTERMKINPTNDYILKTVNKHGKAIIVLGTRKSESSNRSNSMQKYEVNGIRLRKHKLRNAFVYAPIADLDTKEVWAYLINTPNPWNSNNQKLLDLYRSASDIFDCPLVIDDTTPSCGNSRFGCWVCTVVDKDKSMHNMIQNGEEWMQPLFDFRNWLKEIRDDDSRRENIRRNNQDGLGPFNELTRKEILENLLKIEKEINIDLISLQELSAIQLQWHYDGKFNFSVADIYEYIKGEKIMINENGNIKNNNEEKKILFDVCKKYNVNPDHIKELLELEKENVNFLRRGNLYKDIQMKIEKFVKTKNI